jgi:hypothetical protein
MRKLRAVVLMVYGTLTALSGLIQALAGQEVALHVAMVPTGVGIGIGGWLLWRGEPTRRGLAPMLMAFAISLLLMEAHEARMGTDALGYLLTTALRFPLPALGCGWLMWRGHAPARVIAILIVCWGTSYAVQAVVNGADAIAQAVLLTRATLPGLACGWLLWRGRELRQIAAVLLISWPASYLIYSLHTADWNSTIGELTVGVPTIVVGCLLWRNPGARPAPACG